MLALASRDSEFENIRLAPFDDETLTKLGVFIRGEFEEVEGFRQMLDKELEKQKVKFDSLQWQESARRG
jgi:hypothetical protein